MGECKNVEDIMSLTPLILPNFPKIIIIFKKKFHSSYIYIYLYLHVNLHANEYK